MLLLCRNWGIMQNKLESGYVLHHYPFSESSLRLDIFTEETGRLSILAKGARRPKSFWRGLLVPFRPLLFNWTGRSDLKTLTLAEPNGRSLNLTGTILWCGLYLNELLMRLLTPYDTQSEIFQAYHLTLNELAKAPAACEIALRLFERDLLSFLGYGIDYQTFEHGESIEPDVMYTYTPNNGFMLVQELDKKALIVSGASILALATGEFENPDQLREAKMILQAAIQSHLTGKPLQTRRLFKEVQQFF